MSRHHGLSKARMPGAPTAVTEEQLGELGIEVVADSEQVAEPS